MSKTTNSAKRKTHVIQVMCNGKKLNRIKFKDFGEAVREYYDLLSRCPDQMGFELVFIDAFEK